MTVKSQYYSNIILSKEAAFFEKCVKYKKNCRNFSYIWFSFY